VSIIPPHAERYLASRGTKGPWMIEGTRKVDFRGAVVIPSLAENEFLFSTLRSLARNPKDILSRFLTLVVVNHRQDASASDKLNNRETLERLGAGDSLLEDLEMGWVDAASPGRELPPKTGGVGLARKIGFDLALTRLDYQQGSPLLISLDADTLCRPDYLPAIIRNFRNSNFPGAVIPFCHQQGETPAQDRAIRRYELFLRTYVLGLGRAGSPYAFHTVGSAMACTADAYVRIGGMKLRAAGEDFYFLEHLAKLGGIAQVEGTIVYPSARASNRVPFGTGRSMSRLLAREDGVVLFYQTKCFQILANWLDLVTQNVGIDGKAIQSKAETISAHLADYLNQIIFEAYWEKLRKNFHSPSLLLKGFHGWFDGLKTMKLIHHLSAGPFPRKEPEEVVPELLKWAGLEPAKGMNDPLELLRKVQIGGDH
jgi:hypothetical protein